MTEPGDRRPPSNSPAPPPPRRPMGPDRLRPRSLPVALIEALAVALLSAVAWAFLHGVLEFAGALAVAMLGGWLIGEVLYSMRVHPLVAAGVALLAWVAGLVFSWLAAMALLPASSRTLLERIENTSFLDWLSPQFGWVEISGLVLYLAAALFGARSRSG